RPRWRSTRRSWAVDAGGVEPGQTWKLAHRPGGLPPHKRGPEMIAPYANERQDVQRPDGRVVTRVLLGAREAVRQLLVLTRYVEGTCHPVEDRQHAAEVLAPVPRIFAMVDLMVSGAGGDMVQPSPEMQPGRRMTQERTGELAGQDDEIAAEHHDPPDATRIDEFEDRIHKAGEEGGDDRG